MPSQHIWTHKDRHGTKREVRATKFGGAGKFQAKTAGDLEWVYYERPLLDGRLTLKESLAREYQRRRASADDVASVEKLLADEMELGSPRRGIPSAQRDDRTRYLV